MSGNLGMQINVRHTPAGVHKRSRALKYAAAAQERAPCGHGGRQRGAGANSATLNDNDMATGLRHGREDGREERARVEEEEAAERRRRRERGMRKCDGVSWQAV